MERLGGEFLKNIGGQQFPFPGTRRKRFLVKAREKFLRVTQISPVFKFYNLGA